MFDKIKQKLHSSSDSSSEPTQQHHKSTPSINEPTSTTPSSRHESNSSGDSTPATTTTTTTGSSTPNRISISVPNDTQSHSNARGRRTSLAADNVQQRSAASRSRSRARDVLWKNSLFDESSQGGAPKEPNLRAKSLSVAKPHPTMAEEEMGRMPYGDWSRGRN